MCAICENVIIIINYIWKKKKIAKYYYVNKIVKTILLSYIFTLILRDSVIKINNRPMEIHTYARFVILYGSTNVHLLSTKFGTRLQQSILSVKWCNEWYDNCYVLVKPEMIMILIFDITYLIPKQSVLF